MTTVTAYFNGQWIPSTDLRVSVDDLGFLLGATATERLRTFHGQIYRLDDHIARLSGSLDIMGLDREAILKEMAAAIPEFLRRNQGQIDPNDDWAVIAFATPGSHSTHRPTVCVHGHPLPFHQWAEKFDSGVHVVTSQYRQVPPNCWPPELKCRSRMHYYLADREAAAKQPGARAIVLDQDGYIAEATTANVVVYREDEGLISPPYEHILAGVSLTVVKQLAVMLNIPFLMRPITVDEFCQADEAILASTSICVLPIVECNGKPVGDGRPGPVYKKLLHAWSAGVGVDIAEQARRFAARTH